MPHVSRATLSKSSNVPELFNNELPAWNMLVSGDTDSNNQLMTSEIILKEFLNLENKYRPKLVILSTDYKFEAYYKSLQALGPSKTIITQSVKINPFDLTKRGQVPNKKKLDQIVSNFSIPGVDVGYLEKLVMEFYREFETTITLGYPERAERFTQSYFEAYHFALLEKYSPKDILEMITLNPGESTPAYHDFNRIITFLDIILFEGKMTSEEYEEVRGFVLKTYEQVEGRFPRLSDLLKVAKDQGGSEKLISKLSFWTQGGSFSNFDTSETIKLTNDVNIVYFDLKNQTLIQAYHHLLNIEVNRFLAKTEARTIKVYDKIDNFVNHPAMLDQMVEDARTARTHNMAVISLTGTYGVGNLYKTPEGKALILNMSHRVFTGTTSVSGAKSYSEIFKVSLSDVQGLGTKRPFDKKERTHKEEKVKFLYF